MTGSLELDPRDGLQPVAGLFLNLPNDLDFKRTAVPWIVSEDISSRMNLVSRCSDTLEVLSIRNFLSDMFS